MGVLDGELPLPLLVLKNDELNHNIDLMAGWCAANDVSLAPHVKTTMAPKIVARQLRAGAWGITVASPEQAWLMRGVSARRVVIANEIADRRGLRLFADLALRGAAAYSCLVDSEAGIALLEDALEDVEGRQDVLIELGIAGRRAGCRSPELVIALAERLRRSQKLRLIGLEAFEGVAGGEDPAAEVDALSARIAALAHELDRRGAFALTSEVILTAGGSAYFDRIATGLAGVRLGRPIRVVLRSGCYVTHDHGLYERMSPLGRRATGPRFRPALELWAPVISRPEKDLVVLGFGKRDVSYDIEPPRVIGVRAAGDPGGPVPEGGTEVIALHDQHAVARTAHTGLAVGDLVQVGVSHPCTSFDKWRRIPLVGPDYELRDVVETTFREEALWSP